MEKYFIGVDESYDMEKDGNFILSFFIIKNEKDYTMLANTIEKILNNRNINEIKNSQSSEILKEKYFRKLNNINYEYYLYIEKILSHKDIPIYYKRGINNFIKYLNIKYKNINLSLSIKLDRFGGEKTNKEFIKLLNIGFKSFKHISKYENSRSSILIQYADLFAGENRRSLLNENRKNKRVLNKNKILL